MPGPEHNTALAPTTKPAQNYPEGWQRCVPCITGVLGPTAIEMGAKTDFAGVLAQLHATPPERRNSYAGLAVRATTARPLIVGRTDRGTWLVVNLDGMDVLGIGGTRTEALADAKAHDKLGVALQPKK